MTAKIKQLQSDVAKILCSSQVITSPTSLVKELLENSLDANATSVDVKLESFGFDRIEVRDNGCGVNLNEVQYMALSHYTSKISCQSDLEHIATYGFRGQALSAICNVGQVTISTKSCEELGATYQLDCEGKIISHSPCSLNQGTCVVVTKLFNKLPVRKQYYNTIDKKKEEMKNIEDILKAYGLIRPEIRICLYHNKCLIWQKGRAPDIKSSGQQVFGFSVMKHLDETKYTSPDDKISITAYLPKSNSNVQITGRLQADQTFLFVNRRPVKLKKILKTIKHYYSHGNDLMTSQMKYPISCFSVEVPPETIDVNVDPSKEQVFFHNEEEIMIAMEALLEKVYGKMTKSKENVNNDVMELNKESSFLSNDSTNNDIFNYDDVDELLNALESDDINSVQTLSSFQKPLATGAPNEEFLDKNVNPYSSKKHHKAAHGAVVGVNIRTNEPKSESASSIGEETCKQPCVSITNNAAALAPPSKDVVVSAVSVNQNGRTTSEDGQSFLSAEWSKGCIHNSSKELIEPQKLLVGAGKRTSSDDLVNGLKIIDCPMNKKKKMSLNDSHNKTLDGFFASSTANSSQDSSEDKDKRLSETTSTKSRKNDISATSKKIQTPSNQNKTRLVNYKNILEMAQRVVATAKQTARPTPQSVPIKYDMEAIKKHVMECESIFSQSTKETTVVGKLNEFWILYRENKLDLIHHHRVNETLLYKRLMKEHKVATCPLRVPIVLTESLLGGNEWKTLLHILSMDAGSDSVSSVADERITSNGFAIKQITCVQAKSALIHLVAMADHIPCYGIADLRECLLKLTTNWSATLADARPMKVVHYLKGEAMRMAHGQRNHCTKQELLDLVATAEDLLTRGPNECLHGKPLFYTLCNVDESELNSQS